MAALWQSGTCASVKASTTAGTVTVANTDSSVVVVWAEQRRPAVEINASDFPEPFGWDGPEPAEPEADRRPRGHRRPASERNRPPPRSAWRLAPLCRVPSGSPTGARRRE